MALKKKSLQGPVYSFVFEDHLQQRQGSVSATCRTNCHLHVILEAPVKYTHVLAPAVKETPK